MTPRSLPDPTCTNFTVFIRLPFPRDDFVDPPPVEWNASKDQALWDVLSRPSKGDDVDWKALYLLALWQADNLDVTLDFLLQQAAWLYDRQLSKVRAQMRRVGTTHPNTSSPTPGSFWGSNALDGLSPSAEKVALGTGSRAPSRLSMRQKEQPHPVGPQRTNSATSLASVNAATTSRGPRDFSRNTTPTVEEAEPNWDTYDRQPEQKPMPEPIHEPPALEEEEEEEEEEEGSSPSESESEDDDDETDRKGPQFKRFGKFSTYRSGLPEDDDEDEDSPAFLPLNREEVPASQEDSGQDLNATLRLNNEPPDMPRRHTTEEQTPQHQTSDQISAPATRKSLTTTTESSASSASSGVAISRSQTEPSRKASQTRGVLSPRRTAELARHSSRRSNTSGRDPSDGTPSMGSSFSDLDDASVSQSALEEALMSNMQHGGVGSRMSTISQALRSRYL